MAREDGPADGPSPVSRALDLLHTVVQSERPLSLTELAATLSLPSSTVHRLSTLLRREGMLAIDPVTKLYFPGEELVRMSLILSARSDQAALARPALVSIVEQCNETAQFSRYLPDRRAMMFIERVSTTHPLQFALPLFEPQSVLWGSSGRVILAYLGDETIETVRRSAESAPITGRPVPTAAKLREELARIRQRSWDRTLGEKLAYSVGFAAPVFDRNGIFGSVSIPIPSARYDEHRDAEFVGLVTDGARRISRLLGAEDTMLRLPRAEESVG